MTRTRSLTLLCLTALAALSIGVPAALAAPVAPWESISFNVGTGADAPVLIVSGTLPVKATLPAKVELGAPTGTTVQWAGEILGKDPSKDIEVTPVKSQRGGLDIYTFTLTKSRTAQLEVKTVSPVTVNVDVYVVDFTVPVWTDVPKAGVAVQIPTTAQLSETPTGTAGLAPGPTGFQYYQKDFSAVKKGDTLRAKFSYTMRTGGAAAGGSSGGAVLVPILFTVVAVVLGVGLVIGVRRKLSANDPTE